MYVFQFHKNVWKKETAWDPRLKKTTYRTKLLLFLSASFVVKVLKTHNTVDWRDSYHGKCLRLNYVKNAAP